VSSSFRIDSSIWASDWFMAAPEKEKTAFLWSWTNENVTACGVYNPQFGKISKALGFDVRKALRSAEIAKSIFVFDDLQLVLITKFIKHQGFDGPMLAMAIKSLFNQTRDRRIIYAWLAVNRKKLRANAELIRLLKNFRWSITQTDVIRLDDVGNIIERRAFADCSPLGIEPGSDYAFSPESQPESIVDHVEASPVLDHAAEQRVGHPRAERKVRTRSNQIVWPNNLAKQQAEALFDYWRETFEKSARQKLIGKRLSVLHARAMEGLTFVEGKLAILGCYIDGKVRWPERLTNAKAHEFELIFRSNANVHNFVEGANKQLAELGKRVSDDGTQLVSIDGA